MISFTRAFVCSDGNTFATLELAQQHELEALMAEQKFGGAESLPQRARFIIENRERVMDILTTTKSSRPRARKINKTKAPKPAAPAPASRKATSELTPA